MSRAHMSCWLTPVTLIRVCANLSRGRPKEKMGFISLIPKTIPLPLILSIPMMAYLTLKREKA
ncbi:hypothetical protein D3C85_1600980 [compost metagenome]